MGNQTKAEYGSKHILIDAFEVDDVPVLVYVRNNKRSVKEYCQYTEMPINDGIRIFYEGGLRIETIK